MKLHPLKRAKNGNRYCGPAVLSFVCGISTDDAARELREWSGRRAIKGAYAYELHAVFKRHKVRMIGDPLKHAREQPTLASWLKTNRSALTEDRVFLLDAGCHWQLVTGRRYACGRVGEIVKQSDPRVKRRARVKAVYELVAA